MASYGTHGVVYWRGKEVKELLLQATAEALHEAGERVERQAKEQVTENDQVDTGMMRASIYASGQLGSNYQRARREATERARRIGRHSGQTNDPKRLGSEIRPAAGSRTVIVVAGADYSIYQEVKKSFMYRALEREAGGFGGIIRNRAREKGF